MNKIKKNIKYILLIIGLILIFMNYSIDKVNLISKEKVYEKISLQFLELKKQNEQNIMKYLKNEKYNNYIIQTINNQIKYWNTNEIIINEIINQKEGLIKTKNSWLLMHKKQIKDTCIYALTKIKQEYKYENNYLENFYNDKINLNRKIEIVEANKNDKLYFKVENKKYILNNINYKLFYNKSLFFIELIGLGLVLLSLAWIGKNLKNYLFLTLLIFIRIIIYSDFSMTLLKDTDLFNPNLFAWNQYIPSLADLILNFIFLNLISFSIKNHYLKIIVSSVIALLVLSSSHVLIKHSDIELNLENILNLSKFGWLILLIFTTQIIYLLKNLASIKNLFEIIIFTVIASLFEIIHFQFLIPLILFSVLLIQTKFKNHQSLINITNILMFSLIINFNLNHELDEKKKQKIQNILEKKTEKRNIITEYLITDILNEISQKKPNIKEINPKAIKTILQKLPGEFEVNFGECNKTFNCLSDLKENVLVEKNKNYILYYNQSELNDYYIALITHKEMWISLKENKKDEDYGFPILLANPKMQGYYFTTKGSFAKYKNNKLIYSDGKYNFPVNYQKQNNYEVLRTDEYHYVFVDLERKENQWWIGGFYLFFICFTLKNIQQFLQLKGTLSRNFRFKIQLSIILLIFFSISIIAISSVYIQKKQQAQNLQKTLLNNVTLIANSIENKIGVINNLSDLQQNYLQKLIENLGQNYISDINLYNSLGYLENTTREKIYDKGILSEYIHPIPFKKITKDKIKSYIQIEKIGKNLDYFSAYHSIYNDQKKLIGIIQIPYFIETQEFNNDINEYILSIINIYLILIIIALITGYAIAKKVTKPLKILSDNLQNLQLSNLNQKLKWETNDEIGTLIKQYNLTLEKLETNIKKLAQKERESAWREMAQQVAHEIKNPLTPMKLSMQHFLMRWDEMDEETKNKKFKDVALNMIEQMDQLASIASDFSSFAKINEGKKETILLDQVIDNVISVFNTHEIIEYYNEDLNSIVFGNKNELNRVFTNIIQNAIQATNDKNKPKIIIHKKSSNQNVEITITDNGNGIPEEIKDKIFTPKFTTKNSGSGLGLAMVKQIVDLHEGKIEFKSSNNGTSFTILFPKK